ncbi:DNA replication licensing factor MCM6-like AAA ATPase [Cryptosporidium canis]|uniref:DNA replication licensing factor MCM6 n=1 Tax=Cryptosporidium canis TaxID=195482 RepID=A0A9D5HY24_9CRYT|nr:DNA replication licensing factor MCM6-like AAA ATPase [Cryptosporidium canis]
MSNNVGFNSFPPALERSFLHFLRTFKTEDGVPKYVRQVEQLLASRLTRTVYIDVNDMMNFSVETEKSRNDSRMEKGRNTNGLISGPTMLLALTEQYGEYKQAIDNLVTSFCKSFTLGDERNGRLDSGIGGYTASFYGLRWIESLRTLRCEKLGKLCSLRGTITRTSDVRPELLKGCFECEICGCIVDNVVQQFVYSLPSVCPTKGCGNRIAWQLRLENCDFGDWQKLRIQEHATEIPPGSMPRSMNVILRGDFVDKCKPGDKVILTGMLIVAPDVPSLMKPGEIPSSVYKDRSRGQNDSYNSGVTGLKSLGVRDLAYRLCFLACHIEVVNAIASSDDGRIIEQIGNQNQNQGMVDVDENNDEMGVGDGMEGITNGLIGHLKSLNVQETTLKKFLEISQHPNGISLLAKYVAPHVYGYPQLKKGILLLLVGGVEKRTKDNIKLRGDINVCIVGDPSTAKSQILRFVNEFSTRTVYTSGKSSTAAGLTASIHRDPDQGDFVIEAGALMLADKGICCIDEFDKMDDKDVVAIHEAMEQQTISITKAGVLATLNARASVLAACSPIGGRYNPSKTLSQNVRISAPILSRFDLFFVMIDDPEDVYDEVLASFIVGLHSEATEGPSGGGQSDSDMGSYAFSQKQFTENLHFSDSSNLQLSKSELNQYIAYAKTFKPCITPAAKTILVRTYKALRMGDATSGAKAMRITVRQLESLIRLSEAVAKLRFSYLVTPEHVEEACQIFKSSLSKIRYNDIDLDDFDEYDDEQDQEEALKGLDEGDDRESSHRVRSKGNEYAECSDGEGAEVSRDPQTSSNHKVTSRHKKANTTIGYNEYFQIAKRFVDRLQSNENSEISVTDLITWHISEFDHPESEEELSELEEKYHRAIQRMIHRDMILYISFQEEIMSQRDDQDNEVILVTYVKVHPNYNVNETVTLPQPSSGNKPLTRHADFGYRTFQHSEEVNHSSRGSQVVEERDILNLEENLELEDFLPDMDGESQLDDFKIDGERGNGGGAEEEEEEEDDGESSRV